MSQIERLIDDPEPGRTASDGLLLVFSRQTGELESITLVSRLADSAAVP